MHPVAGARLIGGIVDLLPALPYVLHHHERWDGAGYPDGMAAGKIPVGARLLGVADAFDAMTSDRVYRGRLTDDQAIAELARCSGTQFDPDVVAALADELGISGAWPLSVVTATA